MRALIRALPLLTLLVATSGYCQSVFGQRLLAEDTSRLVRICGAVAVGDGFTPVTNLTLSGADEAEALRENTATLDISGATWAAITGADGCYSLTLDTTATATVGELIVVIQDDSLILPIHEKFQVVEEAVYTACCAAAAAPLTAANVVDEFETQSQADPTGFHVNMMEHNGVAQTGRNIGASVLLSPGTGTGQVSLTSGAVTVGTNNDKTGYAVSATGLNAVVMTEPTDVPAWTTGTLPQAMAYVMAWFRNEVTQTADTKALRNDADSANIIECAVSDDATTLTVGECDAPP